MVEQLIRIESRRDGFIAVNYILERRKKPRRKPNLWAERWRYLWERAKPRIREFSVKAWWFSVRYGPPLLAFLSRYLDKLPLVVETLRRWLTWP
jgi:hypothetical protein